MSVVKHRTAGAASLLSPVIWADLPTMQMVASPMNYLEICDDFIKGGVVTDTSVRDWDLVGTNADVEQTVDTPDGEILLEGSGADNDSAFIASADLFLLKKNSGKRFWFEAYVALSAAGTADDYAAFVGLIEKVGATAELIADAGATVIDEDFVGFFAETNATTIQAWNATVNQGGSADFPVNAQADIVAASTTAVKLGMKFDGKKTITFYVNGVASGTFDVDTLGSDTMAHELCVAIGVKDCEAAQLGISVKWVRFVCERTYNGY